MWMRRRDAPRGCAVWALCGCALWVYYAQRSCVGLSQHAGLDLEADLGPFPMRNSLTHAYLKLGSVQPHTQAVLRRMHV